MSISTIKVHTGEVSSACFNYDDTQIVTASNDGTVRLFHRIDNVSSTEDKETWEEIQNKSPLYPKEQTTNKNNNLYRATFNPDDSLILISGVGGTVIVDAKTGNLVEVNKMCETTKHVNVEDTCYLACWYPVAADFDKRRIYATSSISKKIRFFRLVTEKERDEIKEKSAKRVLDLEAAASLGSESSSSSTSLSPETAAAYFTTKVEGFPYFVQIDAYPPLTHHTASTHGIAWANSGSFFVTSSDDSSFAVFDFPSMQMKYHITSAFTKRIPNVAISPDDSLILAVSWDNTAKLFHSEDGSCVQVINDNEEESNNNNNNNKHFVIKGSTYLMHAAFSRCGNKFIISDYSGNTFFYRISTQKPIKLLSTIEHKTQSPGCIWTVNFSNDGNRIVTAGKNKLVEIWYTDRQEKWRKRLIVCLMREVGNSYLCKDGFSVYRIFALTMLFVA